MNNKVFNQPTFTLPTGHYAPLMDHALRSILKDTLITDELIEFTDLLLNQALTLTRQNSQESTYLTLTELIKNIHNTNKLAHASILRIRHGICAS